jgi:hypothetical protein
LIVDLGGLKAGLQSVVLRFGESIPNYKTSIVRAFVTGFTSNPGEIFIGVSGINITENGIELGVEAKGTMEIKTARVNYLVFSPASIPFASYGGGVS